MAEEKPKRFTLDEARQLLPQVKEHTSRAVLEASPIIEKLQDDTLDEETRTELSIQLQELVDAWTNAMHQLGAVTKGLWLVDFDTGSGYYCWRYDEEELAFFHTYEEGFPGRSLIQ